MSGELAKAQERVLLELARKSIEHYFDTGRTPHPETGDPLLREKRGAFVTLKTDGELRGCIGYPVPVMPLDATIAEMAVAAASQDYRFTPLTPEELGRTVIEISVLTLPGRSRPPTRSTSAVMGSSSPRDRPGAFCCLRFPSNTDGTGRRSSATARSRRGFPATPGRRGPRSKSSRLRFFPKRAEASADLRSRRPRASRLDLFLRLFHFDRRPRP